MPTPSWMEAPNDIPASTFHCLTCHEIYLVDAALAGKTIKCRACGAPSRVKAAEPPKAKASPKRELLCGGCGNKWLADEANPTCPVCAGKQQPAAAPRYLGIPRRPPWYYGFVEKTSAVFIVIGGLACIFVMSMSGGSRDPLLVIFTGIVSFLGVIYGAAFALIVVDIGRNIRDIRDKQEKQ